MKWLHFGRWRIYNNISWLPMAIAGSNFCVSSSKSNSWDLLALPGYMDIAVYNIVLYFSAEMLLHFINVATNLIGHICSHISEM